MCEQCGDKEVPISERKLGPSFEKRNPRSESVKEATERNIFDIFDLTEKELSMIFDKLSTVMVEPTPGDPEDLDPGTPAKRRALSILRGLRELNRRISL